MTKDTSYHDLLDNLYDGVYYVDHQRKITFWNKAAEGITGYKKAEVVGFSCADNILSHIDASGHQLCTNGCPLHKTLLDGEKREASVFLHHKSGHRVPVHIRITPILNEAGEVIGGIEVFSDRSKDQDMLQEIEIIRNENFIDPLTQIGNRRYAEMMFETRLYELKAFKVPFAVTLIDLDNFKRINDKHGHNIGDKALQMIAKSLKNILRGSDSIIRWGGDEIVLFLPDITKAGLYEVLERIQIIIENSFIMIKDEKTSLTASVGATFANKRDRLVSIIDRVDKLMYQSKNNGGNRFTVG